MRHSAPPRSLSQDLQVLTREPAGLVCIALVVALGMVIARIAAVW